MKKTTSRPVVRLSKELQANVDKNKASKLKIDTKTKERPVKKEEVFPKVEYKAFYWMEKKVFVFAGLSADHEKEIKKFVTKIGGFVQKDVSSKTNYLIYEKNNGIEKSYLEKTKSLKIKDFDCSEYTYKQWIKLIVNISENYVESINFKKAQNKKQEDSMFRTDDINEEIARFKPNRGIKATNVKEVAVPLSINGKSVKIFDLFGIPNFIQKLTISKSISKLLNLESDVIFSNQGNELERIEVDLDNTTYWSDGYSLFSRDKKKLLRFMSNKALEYMIPNGTETIGKNAFAGMKNLTTLHIPKSVKVIEDYVFEGCNSLREITGTEYVSEVGNNIFSGPLWAGSCHVPYVKNEPLVIIGNTLIKCNDFSKKVINVPCGIKKIEKLAFSGFNEIDSVEEIILPNSIEVIGESAFAGRKKLRKVNVPDGVKELLYNTFSSCESIEVINIPASVESIDISSFPSYQSEGRYEKKINCSLKAIEVDPNNSYYCSIDGMLFSKDKTELLFVPFVLQSHNVQIPSYVRKIGKNLFACNDLLTSMVIPDSVSEIQSNAFYRCTNLEKVILPNNLENIGNYAFCGCENLKEVLFSKNIRVIGDDAFSKCGLDSIILPEGIEHIGSKAFAKTNIEKVSLPKTVKTLGWGAFSCVPEIEIYDSIDPNAGNANDGIDFVNGEPNSLVGYIGIGRELAMWQCAANHEWMDYTIIVKSAETEEIKYKVWMGSTASQRDYFCFLASAWGHNATFAFEWLDRLFPDIEGNWNKTMVAKYRLEYPYELSTKAKIQYEEYLKKKGEKK